MLSLRNMFYQLVFLVFLILNSLLSGGTTVSINYLKKWGYIRPTKELKKMFDDRREVFMEKKQNMTKKFVDKFSSSDKNKKS
jgi:hypothetical protein